MMPMTQKELAMASSQALSTGGNIFSTPNSPPVPHLIPSIKPPTPSQRASQPRNAKEIFGEIVGDVEGEYWHNDEVRSKSFPNGILTSPYGINIRDHKQLLDKLKAASGVARYQDIPLLELKRAAVDLFDKGFIDPYKMGMLKGVTTEQWNKLSEPAKFLVGSATYNGGGIWKGLVKALGEYEAAPSDDKLKKVIAQTTRKVNGKRTAGLDNRSVRDLKASGILDMNNKGHVRLAKEVLYESTELPTPSSTF